MIDKSKYLVLDIESTGIDIIKDDILSLSIFDPKNEVFFTKFFPLTKRKRINNSKIHGITPKYLKGASHFSQQDINQLIEDFDIKNKKILTYGTFDKKMLNVYFSEHGLSGLEFFDFQNIKDLVITNKYHKEVYTKDFVCSALGINGVTEIHSGNNDCLLEWKLFEKIQGQPILMYNNCIYMFNKDYYVPATILCNYPKYQKFVNNYPKPKVKIDEIYRQEIDLDNCYYGDLYFFGLRVERYLQDRLSAIEQDTEKFQKDNFKKLEMIGEFTYPYGKDPKIYFDNKGDMHTELEDINLNYWCNNANKTIHSIDNKDYDTIKYLKDKIFKNDEILYQELVKNEEMHAYAKCDFSNSNAIVELKGSITYNISSHAIQLYIESSGRPIYVLKACMSENRTKLLYILTKVTLIFENKRRSVYELIVIIRNWIKNNNNIGSYYACAANTGIDIQTVEKYFCIAELDLECSKEDVDKAVFINKTIIKNKSKYAGYAIRNTLIHFNEMRMMIKTNPIITDEEIMRKYSQIDNQYIQACINHVKGIVVKRQRKKKEN